MEKELFEWVKATEDLPEEEEGDFNRVCVRNVGNGYQDCLPISFLRKHPSYYEWLRKVPQSSLKEETKIVVWKDGSYKITEGQTWEYENDENWLITIKI